MFDRYKLIFFATDGTTEAKMFCFDIMAKRIVGKPCEVVLRNTHPDLAAIVGLKITLAIAININLYYSAERIFNINSILQHIR
jgi:hypothetical protein